MEFLVKMDHNVLKEGKLGKLLKGKAPKRLSG